MSTGNSIKSKKSSAKESEKKKLQQPSTSDNNANDKGSPEKDCKQYAGISSDIIRNYADQSMFETHLTEDVCNTLSEDINYKLRYIIHDALLKARLTGRNVISAKDIEETFSSLSIERVYGVTNTPNWVPFTDLPGTGSSDQTFYYLDDALVNLIELAEEENTYVQYGDIMLEKKWYPDPELVNPSPALKNYFTIACQSLISDDEDLRQVILKDISENPQVAPILQWFYHFGYFLLMKNITYDCLTLRALDLIETLENSPLSSANVTVKALHLLVRLLLQRLLLSYTSPDILKRMCFTFSILCLRVPLKELAILKINQKLDTVSDAVLLPILTTIYYLGIDAVNEIFLPRITFFLDRIALHNNSEMVYVVLSIYDLICKAQLDDNYVYHWFDLTIPNELVIYWKPHNFPEQVKEKLEVNFVVMKVNLMKTRRKVDYQLKLNPNKKLLEEVFVLPTHDCKISQTLQEFRMGREIHRRETHYIVGKTSLLLSVLNTNSKKVISRCCDHSLSYVI